MCRHFYVFFCLLLSSFILPASADVKIIYSENKEACGFSNQDDKVVLPISKKNLFCGIGGSVDESAIEGKYGIFIGSLNGQTGAWAIDDQGKKMYQIYWFDNGADRPSDGLFRIVKNKKMGYAEASTGRVVIEPMYDCAHPFQNGRAEVGFNCKTEKEPNGEHSIWVTDRWIVIDRQGYAVGSE